MPRLVVGPLVGRVTAATARVLLEADTHCDVCCEAVPRRGPGRRVRLTLQRGRPAVARFRHLRPGAHYALRIRGAESDGEAGFRTWPSNPSRMNVAVVSGESAPGSACDWRDRLARPEDIDLLLQVGTPLDLSRLVEVPGWPAGGVLDARMERRILHHLRLQFRRFLRRGVGHDVGRRVSSLFVWDGSPPLSGFAAGGAAAWGDAERARLAALVQRVHQEYVGDLWFRSKSREDRGAWCQRWGRLGLLAMPAVGMTEGSWARLERAFQPDGRFFRVRALVVVTPTPLSHLGGATSGIGDILLDDAESHQRYGLQVCEQTRLLRFLRQWKERGRGSRDLLVVGGHLPVQSDPEVLRRGNSMVARMVEKPVVGLPAAWYAYWGLRMILESEDRIQKSYSFGGGDSAGVQQFGIVSARAPSRGRPQVEWALAPNS